MTEREPRSWLSERRAAHDAKKKRTADAAQLARESVAERAVELPHDDVKQVAFAIGTAIARARVVKGWSTTELARRSGIAQPHVTHAERGSRGIPSVPTLLRLSRALGGLTVQLAGAILTVRPDPSQAPEDGQGRVIPSPTE